MIFSSKRATIIDSKRADLPAALRKDVETIEKAILHAAMTAAKNPMLPRPRKKAKKKAKK